MEKEQMEKLKIELADLIYEHEQSLNIIAMFQDAQPELYTEIMERLNLV